MTSPPTIGGEYAGWKVTALEKDGVAPRYVVSAGDRKGTLTYYPLTGPRAMTHTNLGARLKRGEGVSHPNLIPVQAGRIGSDGFFVVTQTLERLHKLGDPPQRPPEALSILRVIADVLGAFEEKGRVHGELDVWCLVRKSDGSPAVMPPGLRLPPPGVERLGLEVDPAYAPPELLDLRQPTLAGDMFSAGLILYRLLTGKRPVASKDPTDAFAERGKIPAPDLAASRLPNPVKGLYAKLVASDPRQRPHSIAELKKDIEAAAQGNAPQLNVTRAPELRPVRVGGSLLNVLLAAGLAAGLYYVADQVLAPKDPLADLSFPLEGGPGAGSKKAVPPGGAQPPGDGSAQPPGDGGAQPPGDGGAQPPGDGGAQPPGD